jgi:hypothetical protein
MNQHSTLKHKRVVGGGGYNISQVKRKKALPRVSFFLHCMVKSSQSKEVVIKNEAFSLDIYTTAS